MIKWQIRQPMAYVFVGCLLILAGTSGLQAQSNSMYHDGIESKNRMLEQAKQDPANTFLADKERHQPLNQELEEVSLIAVKSPPVNSFVINDLLTVIVREQKEFKSDSELGTERKFEATSEIDKFFKFIGGHLGAATFAEGTPEMDISLDTKIEGEGDVKRNDRLTFRITVRIIDIKPNGLLVLEGRKRIEHDEEVMISAITGVCRSEDVTADNTILSTQIYDQVIAIRHEGALKDAAKRGWLTRLVDWLNPI